MCLPSRQCPLNWLLHGGGGENPELALLVEVMRLMLKVPPSSAMATCSSSPWHQLQQLMLPMPLLPQG